MAKMGFTVAKEKAEEANKSTAKYNYFKLEPNKDAKRIRFITVDGPEASILTYDEHYLKFKNTWSRPFSCPDYDNDGEKTCQICKADKGPSLDITQDQFGRKFIMQVIERGVDGAEDTLKVFKFSPFLFTTLLSYYDKTGDLGDRDYTIAMIKEKDENNKEKMRYEVLPVTAKKEKLSPEDLELIETRAKLSDIEPAYDMNEVRRLAAMELGGGKPNAPSASSLIGDLLGVKVPKKPATVVADDDEDTEPTVVKSSTTTLVADEEEDDEDAHNFFNALKKHQNK
jgi:hypothetical protein